MSNEHVPKPFDPSFSPDLEEFNIVELEDRLEFTTGILGLEEDNSGCPGENLNCGTNCSCPSPPPPPPDSGCSL